MNKIIHKINIIQILDCGQNLEILTNLARGRRIALLNWWRILIFDRHSKVCRPTLLEIFGLMVHRTIGYSDYWSFRPMVHRNIGISPYLRFRT